jgi:hypothetical protein
MPEPQRIQLYQNNTTDLYSTRKCYFVGFIFEKSDKVIKWQKSRAGVDAVAAEPVAGEVGGDPLRDGEPAPPPPPCHVVRDGGGPPRVHGRPPQPPRQHAAHHEELRTGRDTPRPGGHGLHAALPGAAAAGHGRQAGDERPPRGLRVRQGAPQGGGERAGYDTRQR